MPFVELHRDFVPLKKDQPVSLDVGRAWGRRLGGWLTWAKLLSQSRVIVLAEAASGKTEEFKQQQALLLAAGKPAFFLRIEELADRGFAAALSLEELAAFDRWRKTASVGWFFLDSIDEARLVQKSFISALKQFARELGDDLDRVHAFISCRVTDWRGVEDYDAVNRFLPVRQRPCDAFASEAPKDSLLDPLFVERTKTVKQPDNALPANQPILLQLVPLSSEQYRTLAQANGIDDVDAFASAISQNELAAFAERPGDLLDLANYWRDNQKFGSARDMFEYGVARKLAEASSHRADSHVLSASKAREGAEQIAAALTFGKTFTLKAPNHDPDPSLAAGALDVAAILPDWTEEETNALLRRGIFAPATYGRVRFHHRSTQEYLTAEWLNRLLSGNCPLEEISQMLFTQRYGVETIVPSLRPVVAWLAHRQPQLRADVIRREPTVLMRYGDPGSLPLQAREELLTAYAAEHASAKRADGYWDGRSLWMFADPGLASAIKRAWAANPKDDFHAGLLRLIRAGVIQDCVALAAKTALDEAAEWHCRILALEAVAACGDEKTLAAVARQVMKNPSAEDSRLAASFASVLYPKYLKSSALIRLIRDTQPPPKGSIAGFGHAIEALCEAASKGTERKALIGGLADLCLAPPFVDEHHRISKQFRFLARALHKIALVELKCQNVLPSSWLIRLLMVVERVEPPASFDKKESLHDLLRPHRELSRALFWADIDEQRRNATRGDQLIRHWQVYLGGVGRTLWEFIPDDRDWLCAQMHDRPQESDRRILLGAIMALTRPDERPAIADQLRPIIMGSGGLEADIMGYLTAPPEDPEMMRFQKQQEARAQKQKEEEVKARTSWEAFADQLRGDPSLLSNPENLRSWKAGAFRLKHMFHWLQKRSQVDDEKALRDWPLLAEGFGKPVAQAFREGLSHLWRRVRAKRPERTSENSVTVSWISILAFGAIGVEAAEDFDWVSKLTGSEAKRAAQHACFAEQGYPDWLDQLINAFPQEVLPVIREALLHDWKLDALAAANFLHRYAYQPRAITPATQEILLSVFAENEAGRLHTLELGLTILGKMTLTEAQRAVLTKVARRRLKNFQRTKKDYALRYLAMLFLLKPGLAVATLELWIERGSSGQKERAEEFFSALFERHEPLIGAAFGQFSVPILDQLLQLAYRHIQMADDIHHEGSFTPGERDRAESARDTILSALMTTPGSEAYAVIRRAADNPNFRIRADRFRQLARQKAEQDSELVQWQPAEIVKLRTKHVAPVKTGHDLFRVVLAVLNHIKFRLAHYDFTSRPLLERASDEDLVQNWLVEQINFLSKDRYHAFREAEISGGNKPDVIVASTGSPVEVAIEVKHGGKDWSVRKLEDAVRKQLAVDYLKPATRRDGVFVITNHRDRFWINRKTRERLSFDQLVEHLSRVAESITHNGLGEVSVAAIGLNACRPTLRKAPLAKRKQTRPSGRNLV